MSLGSILILKDNLGPRDGTPYSLISGRNAEHLALISIRKLFGW